MDEESSLNSCPERCSSLASSIRKMTPNSRWRWASLPHSDPPIRRGRNEKETPFSTLLPQCYTVMEADRQRVRTEKARQRHLRTRARHEHATYITDFCFFFFFLPHWFTTLSLSFKGGEENGWGKINYGEKKLTWCGWAINEAFPG